MLPTQLPIFICVAKEGSFSAAGRKLGISAAAVSKAIAVLETQTGIRLFHRSTRKLSLTHSGHKLYQQTEPLLSKLENCIDSLTDQNQIPSGKLRVNLPDSFGHHFVVPYLSEFLSLYPDIELDITLSDKVLDIIEEGFDVSVGNQINEDSRLVARTIYQMQIGLFASKTYIEQYGMPNTLEQLSQHNALVYRPLSSRRVFTWSLQDNNGEHVEFAPQGNLTFSTISAVKMVMQQNLGIAYMGKWHVEEQLKDGSVIPILESAWVSEKPVWIYYSSRENLPKRTRVFIDFMVEKLAAA